MNPIKADPTAVSRKKDHIEMAFLSQVEQGTLDTRFYYEPLLAAHPDSGSLPPTDFLGKTLKAPLWVSSMTGGTEMANRINHNLAKACGEFGMGMGLGSCRQLLHNDDYLKDFFIRPLIGYDNPLYANLGVAQVEELIDQNQLYLIDDLLDKLEADGLIIHVNPLQEWLQPEGDRYKRSALEVIEIVLDKLDIRVIVKEVGQGFGYHSLTALFKLPIEAIDFAASGGTNFSKLELLRNTPIKRTIYEKLANVGHSAVEMVIMSNEILEKLGDEAQCKQVIISGGLKNFLDGYYLINKLNTSCIYGMASGFLKHSTGEYEELQAYAESQIQGLELANAFLKIR